MARAVYSTQIIIAGTVTASIQTVVPSGLLYVVRDVDVTNKSGGANDQLAFIGSHLQIIWNVFSNTATAFRSQQWQGRQVFNEGEAVKFTAAVGTWDISCCGYQLTLP